eukprot:COSAG01_NODE_1137_length_11546_cov_14.463091_9_plen_185_part_00
MAGNRGWLRTETLGHAALSSPQHPASSQPSPPRVISSSFGRSAPPRPNACLAPAPPGPTPPSPNTFCAVEAVRWLHSRGIQRQRPGLVLCTHTHHRDTSWQSARPARSHTHRATINANQAHQTQTRIGVRQLASCPCFSSHGCALLHLAEAGQRPSGAALVISCGATATCTDQSGEGRGGGGHT